MLVEQDQNIESYKRMKAEGAFNDLPLFIWVGFIDGVFVGKTESLDEIEKLKEEGKDLFVAQPNIIEEIIPVPSVLSIEDINLGQ